MVDHAHCLGGGTFARHGESDQHYRPRTDSPWRS